MNWYGSEPSNQTWNQNHFQPFSQSQTNSTGLNFLQKLFGKNQFVGSPQQMYGNIPKMSSNYSSLHETLNHIQKGLNLIQQATPYIKQYGPFVKNLPMFLDMMKIMMENDDEEENNNDDQERKNEIPDSKHKNKQLQNQDTSPINQLSKKERKSVGDLPPPKLYI